VASSKRERELARMRAERQAARRAAAQAQRRRRRNVLLSALAAIAVVAIVAAVVLATRGGGSKTDKLATSSPPPAVSSSGSTSTPVAGQCSYKAAGSPSKPIKGTPPVAPPRKPLLAKLTTNRGEVDLALNTAKAPCTVGSFAFLAGQKYFDGTSCHRLTSKGIFVLQCGDPTGTGSGGPGYAFADENLTGATYKAGTVAMANAGPGTNGSQFFLVYKDTQLPPSYTPFGTITAGLPVLAKVAAAGSVPADDGKPKLPVMIAKVVLG